MKLKELIAALQTIDPDTEIELDDFIEGSGWMTSLSNAKEYVSGKISELRSCPLTHDPILAISIDSIHRHKRT